MKMAHVEPSLACTMVEKYSNKFLDKILHDPMKEMIIDYAQSWFVDNALET